MVWLFLRDEFCGREITKRILQPLRTDGGFRLPVLTFAKK